MCFGMRPARLFRGFLHIGQQVVDHLPQLRGIAGEQRLFEIPIEYWCAATGQAVDVAGLRRLIAGTATIESLTGDGWTGDGCGCWA